MTGPETRKGKVLRFNTPTAEAVGYLGGAQDDSVVECGLTSSAWRELTSLVDPRGADALFGMQAAPALYVLSVRFVSDPEDIHGAVGQLPVLISHKSNARRRRAAHKIG